MEATLRISRKKQVYPISRSLRQYLRRFRRETVLPLSYTDLTAYQESVPLTDRDGRDTFWETVIYPSHLIDTIHRQLREIYARLKAGGNVHVQEHLFIDRVDFCLFANTNPFRIRIVNRYNDVYDYFYIKVADASRIYGLELEHLLSPNQLNYFVDRDTLVEEHIAGIPGDQFTALYLSRPEYNPGRIAKEFVKFNERCMLRLLGDMRAYNFVLDITPDFDDFQFRIRPIDFDQQFYEGKMKIYQPQFFKENLTYVQLALRHLNEQVIRQYQEEERSILVQRMRSERTRLAFLRDALQRDEVTTPEKLVQLREELSDYYQDDRFLKCSCTASLLDWNLKRLIVRRRRG